MKGHPCFCCSYIGCGLGLTFLSTIVIVTRYLPKNRSVASGLALSGGGIGAFVFRYARWYTFTFYKIIVDCCIVVYIRRWCLSALVTRYFCVPIKHLIV